MSLDEPEVDVPRSIGASRSGLRLGLIDGGLNREPEGLMDHPGFEGLLDRSLELGQERERYPRLDDSRAILADVKRSTGNQDQYLGLSVKRSKLICQVEKGQVGRLKATLTDTSRGNPNGSPSRGRRRTEEPNRSRDRRRTLGSA